MIKVKERQKTLCQSCTNGQIIVFVSGAEQFWCSMLPGITPILKDYVVECNSYERIGSLALHEMTKIAWILEIGKSRQYGFVSPGKRKKNSDDIYDQMAIPKIRHN